MYTKKVEIPGVNTSNIKTLTNEEMITLFEQYHNGDQLAKDKLVEGNLKLVLSILKKFKTTTNNINDMFQIGCIGLIKAIDNFNIELNVAFSTYAIPMIIGEIKRYLRDNNNVKISRQIKDLAYKILKFKEKYMIINNKEPTIKEICESLNETQYKVDEAIKSLNCVVSLQESILNDDSDELTYLDQISDDYDFEKNFINYNTLRQGIKKLDNTQRSIILKRYYQGKTQEEIANELFISQAQVSRLEKSAINNLKKLF